MARTSKTPASRAPRHHLLRSASASSALTIKEASTLERRIRTGLVFGFFAKLREALGLAASELADLLQVAPRTLARRKSEGRFAPDESERLARVALVYDQALALFEGDEQGARAWLGRCQPGLGGRRPLDLVRSELGARQVEELIGRLEHGSPS